MKDTIQKSESKLSLSKSESFSSQSSYESDYSYDSENENSGKAQDDKTITDLIEQAQNMNLAIARSLVENGEPSSQKTKNSDSSQENSQTQSTKTEGDTSNKIGKWVKAILKADKKSEQDRGI